MGRLFKVLLLLLSSVAAGCTPSIRGGPERLFSIEAEAQMVRGLASNQWIDAYAKSTGSRRSELRDQIVLARMYAVDVYYSDYEAQLTQERQNVGFFSTVASLALTGTAATIASTQAKSVLSAVATGLTGTKSAYDKEILIEKTISILQQQMRTRRNEIKGKIIERLSLNASSYPLELALLDVEAYYRGGTITGALINVSELTGTRLAESRQIEDSVVITKFAPITDLGARIRAYARLNLQEVTDYLAGNHAGLPFAIFIRTAKKADQQRMINKLNIQ